MVISMEEIYEEIVIYRIEKEKLTLDEKCNLLIDFHRNGKKYYDFLCDYSYILSNRESNLYLWISLNGKPHLSLRSPDSNAVKVLEPNSVPTFNGDLIDSLSVILHNLSNYQRQR